MKRYGLRYYLYISSLLIVILLFSVINAVLSFGVSCQKYKAENIEQFRNMKICKNIFQLFQEDTPKWKKDYGKKIIGDTYYWMYQCVLSDIKCFPVQKDPKGKEEVAYENSWLAERSYGGPRTHEGTDIMPSKNEPGYFSVVSVSDGIIENIGWLEKGGKRIGVRSESGAYFYYAHLHEYGENIKEGMHVKAGDILGTMGDSGYGKEGTVGQFPVHLHFGIYIDIEGKETSVNPYWILGYLERN